MTREELAEIAARHGAANGAFLAAARMDVLALVAEVRRLRAALETVRDHVDMMAPAEVQEYAAAVLDGRTRS